MQKVFNARTTLLRSCGLQDHNISKVLFTPTQLMFKLNLSHDYELINEEQGIYNVNVTVTINAFENTATLPEQEAGEPIYTAVTKYSGIFIIQNFTEEELEVVLNVNAPSMVFPYARAEINRMLAEVPVPKPQLQPHQFDVSYQEKKKAEKEKEKNKSLEEEFDVVEDTEE